LTNVKLGIQTKKALKLIKNKSKTDFKKISKYLKVIKQSKKSGIIPNQPKFYAGNKTAFHSVEWYASAIVHDTHHYYLHSTKKLIWTPKTAKKHEKLCIKEQIKFLKKAKAPKSWIEYCGEVINTKYWLKNWTH